MNKIVLILIITCLAITLSALKIWSLEPWELEMGTGKGEQTIRPMRFNNPKIKDPNSGKMYRLDWCFHWGKNCGKVAADAFCKNYGFKYAKNYEQDSDIGHLTPTLVMGDSLICPQKYCDGFIFIECAE